MRTRNETNWLLVTAVLFGGCVKGQKAPPKKPAKRHVALYSEESRYSRDWNERAIVAHVQLQRLMRPGTSKSEPKTSRRHLVEAHIRLADAYWDGSCTGETSQGVCWEKPALVSAETVQVESCGPASVRYSKIANRTPIAKKAILHWRRAFEILEAEAENSEFGKDEKTWYQNYIRFQLLYPRLEKYLSIRFPSFASGVLDPHSMVMTTEGKKAFMGYIKQKGALAKELDDAYLQIAQAEKALLGVSALAMAGLVFDGFLHQLWTAEVPRELTGQGRPQELRYAFCDAIFLQTDPLEKQAKARYVDCIEMAQKGAVSSNAAKYCIRVLNRFSPNEYPVDRELQAGE